MSPKTDDQIDKMPEAELLALPGEAIPSGRLTAFFTRRAEILRQGEWDEMVLERNGGTLRHFMIFAENDPKAREAREEAARRKQMEDERERLAYIERSDRLLADIDAQQRTIAKRRQEIEDRAIRLRDGRKVFVDGDQYRDEQGRILTGADRDEAAGQHREHPEASTWAEREQAIRDAEEAQRIKDKILRDRESGQGTTAEKTKRLSGYEQEFREKIEARAAQPVAEYGAGDYMAELGDLKPSTVPAFTAAAQIASHETNEQPPDREGESGETKKTQRPPGLGALKLG